MYIYKSNETEGPTEGYDLSWEVSLVWVPGLPCWSCSRVLVLLSSILFWYLIGQCSIVMAPVHPAAHCPCACLSVSPPPLAACLLDIQNLENQIIQNLESQDIQSIGIQKLSSDFVSIKLHVTQSGTEVCVSRTTTLWPFLMPFQTVFHGPQLKEYIQNNAYFPWKTHGLIMTLATCLQAAENSFGKLQFVGWCARFMQHEDASNKEGFIGCIKGG